MKLWKKTCQNSPIEEIPHEKYTHEDETETQNFELDDSETPYEDIFDEDKTTMI